MGVKAIQCFFIFLLGFLFSSVSSLSSHSASDLQILKKSAIHQFKDHRLLYSQLDPESLDTMPQMDVVTPTTTIPIVNPTGPTTTTPVYNPVTNPYTTPVTNPNPYTTPTNPPTDTNPDPNPNPVTNPNPTPTPTPTMPTPVSSSGQSWCVASQSAAQTALQVALDYACGYGGADCSAIQQGGSCFNPATVRDHASYAFNSYYQKNPAPTSCDFGGTAMITNTDPSTSTCHFPSTSTSSSTLNTTTPTTTPMTTPTTTPTGPTVFGSSPPDGLSPPDYGGSISMSSSKTPSFTLLWLLISLIYLKFYK